ncbi:MAG: hypothetical protein AAF092_10600 [Pseudomonadota bacterium]
MKALVEIAYYRGCKRGDVSILRYLHLHHMCWKTGTTERRVSHAMIADDDCAGYNTVKNAIARLRANGILRVVKKGSITPVGGRYANAYEFAISPDVIDRVAGQLEWAKSAHPDPKYRGRKTPTCVGEKRPPSVGEKSPPHPVSLFTRGNEDAASRRENHKAPGETERYKPKNRTPPEPELTDTEELRIFSREVDLHGYLEARRLAAARAAQSDAACAAAMK